MYKKTNDYEQMVSTVVGLLTERDEDIILLKRESLKSVRGKNRSRKDFR